jgi:hypothetical protein
LVWWFGRLIDLLYPRTSSNLLDEFYRSIEVIQERTQVRIDLSERLVFLMGVETIVADGPANGEVVLLLHEAIIVLSVGTTPSELNPGVVAIVEKYGVDELTSIVAIHSVQGKR